MDKFSASRMKYFCNDIINNYNKIHGKNLIIEDFLLKSINHEVIGYLAEYNTLTLKCIKNQTREMVVAKQEAKLVEAEQQEKVEIHLFIKTLPRITDKADERLIIFQKESNLYRHLLPKLRDFSLNIWLPRVYLCRHDILVLEDLRYSGGNFIHCLNQRKANAPEMFAILKALASMHCSSLIYEERSQCRLDEQFSNYLNEISIDMNIRWFNVGLKTLLEVAKYYHPLYKCNNMALADLEDNLKSICEMAKTSKKYRNVLCHRDTWGGNILLNGDSTNVCFVDFQCCRYCPPAIDVIFTLFMNLSKNDLLQYHEEFLAFYYTELITCFRHYQTTTNSNDLGAMPISRDEFYQSYQDLKLIGLVYRAIAATITKVSKTMVDDNYKNVERFPQLQKYMQDNREFRQLMLDYTQDIIDYVKS